MQASVSPEQMHSHSKSPTSVSDVMTGAVTRKSHPEGHLRHLLFTQYSLSNSSPWLFIAPKAKTNSSSVAQRTTKDRFMSMSSESKPRKWSLFWYLRQKARQLKIWIWNIYWVRILFSEVCKRHKQILGRLKSGKFQVLSYLHRFLSRYWHSRHLCRSMPRSGNWGISATHHIQPQSGSKNFSPPNLEPQIILLFISLGDHTYCCSPGNSSSQLQTCT